MTILKTIASNKRAFVKAITASDSIVDCGTREIVIDEAHLIEKDDKTVMIIHEKDGVHYSSTSPTVIQSFEAILSVVEEREILDGLPLSVCKKMSKNKREFYFLELA